jgi:hypothetical protein
MASSDMAASSLLADKDGKLPTHLWASLSASE